MKLRYLITASLLAAGLASGAHAETCRVTDPTGSPLNVRATPNGLRLGSLENGTYIVRHNSQYDAKNRPWVYISWQGQPLNRRLVRNAGLNTYHEGWVFREFVSCY